MAPPIKIKKAAEEAVERFDNSRRALLDFISDNSAVFDVFYELVSTYNDKNGEAKSAVGLIQSDNGFSLGPFRRTNTSLKSEFDASELSAKVLKLPGVAKVDAKVLEDYIANGKVKFEEVADARGEYRTNSQVRGPLVMQIKVG